HCGFVKISQGIHIASLYPRVWRGPDVSQRFAPGSDRYARGLLARFQRTPVGRIERAAGLDPRRSAREAMGGIGDEPRAAEGPGAATFGQKELRSQLRCSSSTMD